MRTSITCAYRFTDPAHRVALADLASEQKAGRQRVIAAAGVGRPERFFAMLRESGLDFSTVALNDHFDFTQNPFAGQHFDRVFVTEKDAVKCAANPALANDVRLFVVPLEASVEAGLVDLIEARIKPTPKP
jgi:tetraacyldisaccharide 4'-kinase